MKKRTVALVSAAVLTAGLGVGATQLATAETPTPSPTASPTDSPQKTPARKGGHGDRAKLDLSGLASKLGVDETKLSEAVSAARKATAPTEQTKPSEAADR